MDMRNEAALRANQNKVRAAPVKTAEFLNFRLGGEEYGIDVLRVQAIRSFEEPARIANAPSFITGIASVGERRLILMDIDVLMSRADMGLMDCASQPSQLAGQSLC